MEITLNHTIVPAHDRVKSAKWYEEVFGFTFLKEWGHFAVVRVNSTLTFDFMNRKDRLPFHHYAFKVNDQQFDEVLGRVKGKNIPFCSGPGLLMADNYDYKTNNYYGGRGVYFKDPNGHSLEILTVDYDLNSDSED